MFYERAYLFVKNVNVVLFKMGYEGNVGSREILSEMSLSGYTCNFLSRSVFSQGVILGESYIG